MGMPRESRLQENGETEFDAGSSATVPLDAFRTVNQGSEFTVTWSSGHARGRIVYSLVLGAAIRDDQYATEHGPIGSDRSRESRESIVGRCRCSVRHAPPKPYVCQRQAQTVRLRQPGTDPGKTSARYRGVHTQPTQGPMGTTPGMVGSALHP